jgi:hypothetical protein
LDELTVLPSTVYLSHSSVGLTLKPPLTSALRGSCRVEEEIERESQERRTTERDSQMTKREDEERG